ncbi:MAG: hypothetical protein MI923_19950 [Phycisphaerales bacterium]|nr:hypothetical protein [Phycisphaerales bacterium]
MKRQFVLVGVLVLLCGISIFVWTTMSDDKIDSAQKSIMETIKCHSCGHQFEMSVQNQTLMLKGGKGLQCPSCKAWSAAPEYDGGASAGVVSFLGETQEREDEQDNDSQDEEYEREAAPPAPAIGRQRIKP